ncbi:hypothetical protein D9615_008766 [Tricholomella constricta]|uniref:Uncharacterized protein n=1 Tax=Tricholomella constricta TaxID=117010 RepID=A0A8H5H7G6_9AGAR|nr:hypothetical protein D9615_008766 [Tricholomella constricta]
MSTASAAIYHTNQFPGRDGSSSRLEPPKQREHRSSRRKHDESRKPTEHREPKRDRHSHARDREIVPAAQSSMLRSYEAAVEKNDRSRRLERNQPQLTQHSIERTSGKAPNVDVQEMNPPLPTAGSAVPKSHRRRREVPTPVQEYTSIPMVARVDTPVQTHKHHKHRKHHEEHAGQRIAVPAHGPMIQTVDPFHSNRATWASSTAGARWYPQQASAMTGSQHHGQIQRGTSKRYPTFPLPNNQPIQRQPSGKPIEATPFQNISGPASGSAGRTYPFSHQPQHTEPATRRPLWKSLFPNLKLPRLRFPTLFKFNFRRSPSVNNGTASRKLYRKPRVQRRQKKSDAAHGRSAAVAVVAPSSSTGQRISATIQRPRSWFKRTASGSKFIEAL